MNDDYDPIDIRRVASNEIDKLANLLEKNEAYKISKKLRLLSVDLDLSDLELQKCWGGPFNGQEKRRELFKKIIEKIPVEAIVETGTFRGVTTRWLSENFSGPIYTCELNERYYLQAQKNLESCKNVKIFKEDSISFLRNLSECFNRESSLLFYLDAHWEESLPLFEEVCVLKNNFPNSIVMIDDFEVPGDAGYAYDDYGPDKIIGLNYLRDFKDNTDFFLPSVSSNNETGSRRGFGILAWSQNIIGSLKTLNELKSATESDWDLAKINSSIVIDKNHLSVDTLSSAGLKEIVKAGMAEVVEAYAVRLASATAHAILSPEKELGQKYDANWGNFLIEFMNNIECLKRGHSERLSDEARSQNQFNDPKNHIEILKSELTRSQLRAQEKEDDLRRVIIMLEKRLTEMDIKQKNTKSNPLNVILSLLKLRN